MSIDLNKLIANARKEVEKPAVDELEIAIAGEIVKFEFTKLSTFEWRELMATFPPRDGVPRDMNVGYNLDRLPKHYPVANIKIVTGEDRLNVDQEQWYSLFDVIESPELFHISVLLWGMHEWAPSQKLVEAKKALTKKSGSSRKS